MGKKKAKGTEPKFADITETVLIAAVQAERAAKATVVKTAIPTCTKKDCPCGGAELTWYTIPKGTRLLGGSSPYGRAAQCTAGTSYRIMR